MKSGTVVDGLTTQRELIKVTTSRRRHSKLHKTSFSHVRSAHFDIQPVNRIPGTRSSNVRLLFTYLFRPLPHHANGVSCRYPCIRQSRIRFSPYIRHRVLFFFFFWSTCPQNIVSYDLWTLKVDLPGRFLSTLDSSIFFTRSIGLIICLLLPPLFSATLQSLTFLIVFQAIMYPMFLIHLECAQVLLAKGL